MRLIARPPRRRPRLPRRENRPGRRSRDRSLRDLSRPPRDGLLPQWAAKLHPRTKIPFVTTLLTGIFVSGVLYGKYRGFGAAGTACAAGGSILVAAGAGCPTCLVPAAAALGVVIPLVSLPLAGVEFLIVNFVVLVVLVLWFARRVRSYAPTGMRTGSSS